MDSFSSHKPISMASKLKKKQGVSASIKMNTLSPQEVSWEELRTLTIRIY